MSSKQEVYFNNIRDHIIRNIETANKEIYIAVAWFTDVRIIESLLTRLHNGAKVSIIVFDDKINIKDLFEALYYNGAEIRFSKKLMHNKFCVIDNEIVINGSYNWTNNATNNEENIQVTLGNKDLARQFITQHEALKANAAKIDDHFRYKLETLNEEEEDNFTYYYGLEKPSCGTSFPYFYKLSDLKRHPYHSSNRLREGIYIIKNEIEEIDFFRYCYYLQKEYDLNKLEQIFDLKFRTPHFFTRIINPCHVNFLAISIDKKKHLVELDICKPRGEIISSYAYWIGEDGNVIGKKVKYTQKFQNGYYYHNGYKKLYDPILRLIDLNFYIEGFVDEFGFISSKGSYSDVRYGLYNIYGKLIVDNIYDDYLLIPNEGIVKFFEYFLFAVVDNQVLAIEKENQRINLKSSKEVYAKVFTYHKRKQLVFNGIKLGDNLPELVESTSMGTGFQLTEENGCYKVLYTSLYYALLRSNKTLSLQEFNELRNQYLYFTRNSSEETKQVIAKRLIKKYDTVENSNINKSTYNSSCYIATMVYDDINHPKVQILRDYRDNRLSKRFLGKKFINFYYKTSPFLVKYVNHKIYLKALIKLVIDKIVDAVI